MLANPSVDLLEGPSVTKEQLKGLGVRPYGPKVSLTSAASLLGRWGQWGGCCVRLLTHVAGLLVIAAW